MEISRQYQVNFGVQAEVSAMVNVERCGEAKAQEGASANTAESNLEVLRDAMRSVADVDLEKVAAIKQALNCGEIVSDSVALAGSMLAYHGGSDA